MHVMKMMVKKMKEKRRKKFLMQKLSRMSPETKKQTEAFDGLKASMVHPKEIMQQLPRRKLVDSVYGDNNP